MSNEQAPLAGIKVIELGSMYAAPTAGRMLRDFGADVVKVEDPTSGDFARQWQPRGPLLVALEGVYSATDPPIVALRRVVPPLRIGSVALDLSFLLVMVGAWLLLQVVATIFGL